MHITKRRVCVNVRSLLFTTTHPNPLWLVVVDGLWFLIDSKRVW